MPELKYPSGFFYNKPHEKAPDFVLASISIRPDVFIEWLKEQKPNDHGYVRLDALMGQARGNEPAKPYCKLNDYNGEKKEVKEVPQEDISADDIPF